MFPPYPPLPVDHCDGCNKETFLVNLRTVEITEVIITRHPVYGRRRSSSPRPTTQLLCQDCVTIHLLNNILSPNPSNTDPEEN
jgi:hypothetical protein